VTPRQQHLVIFLCSPIATTFRYSRLQDMFAGTYHGRVGSHDIHPVLRLRHHNPVVAFTNPEEQTERNVERPQRPPGVFRMHRPRQPKAQELGKSPLQD
jgi:hypothetical protein